MPLGPRRTARPIRRGSRRRLTWADTGENVATPAATQQAIVDLLAQLTPSTLALQEAGMTVRRTIITGMFNPTTPTDIFHIALAVLRRNDTSASTSSLDPASVATETWGIDWAYNRTYYPTTSGATVDANLVFNIDTKVMRRITDPGLRWCLVFGNPNAAARTLQWRARTLVALP